KDRELDGFELSNIAGFDGYTTGSGTGIRQMVGTKSATNINYKDQIITWKVQVNLDEHHMNNVVVTDTIGEGLTLIDDSVQVNGTNTNYKLNNGNELVVNLGDLTTSAEITYQTTYDPENLPEVDEQLIANNKANIEWTPEGLED